MSSYVYVKNLNGKIYVYENTIYWEKENKACKYKWICIGHLDLYTGAIIANRKKVMLQDDIEHDIVMNIGVSLLLDKMVDKTGVKLLLPKVFVDDWQKILICAYYLVSEGGALCYVLEWITHNRASYNAFLISQRITWRVSYTTDCFSIGDS